MKNKNLMTAMLAVALSLSFGMAQAAQTMPSTSHSTQPAAAASSAYGASGSMQDSTGHYAQINGAKIHYQVSGHGEPLLLIHGFPLDGNLFMRQRQHLSRHFKVITPDLPGFGRSTAADDNATLTTYAHAMFGLMDKLGIHKAIIGGHSMGGMTVLEMYKEQPERFAGMILIDTAAIAAPLPRKHLWKGYAQLAQQSGNHTTTMNNLLIPNMLSYHARKHDKQLVNQMKAMVKAASTAGVVGGANALANRADYTGELSSIDVPTLIIVGSQDTITPVPIAKNMHKAIKGSNLAIIKGASHAAILEKANQADKAIMRTFGDMRTQNADIGH